MTCFPVPVSAGCEYTTFEASGRFRFWSILSVAELGVCDGAGEGDGFTLVAVFGLLGFAEAAARLALNPPLCWGGKPDMSRSV